MLNPLFNLIGAVQAADQAAEEMAPSGSGGSYKQAKDFQTKMLYENLARAMLISEALWELLKEHTGLTVEDLHKKLYEIDMQDGQIDGKNERKAVQCPNCKHTVSPRHTSCLYCGQVIDDTVFRLG